jgi:hypothetical protein
LKLNAAGFDGVPLMTPVLESMLRPAGSPPSDIDHVYGIVPPLAAIGREYGAFAVPPGSEVVVIINGPPMVIERAFESRAWALSSTCIVKFETPGAVGVPEITPVVLVRVRPAGSEPAGIDQVSGRVPPAATAILEYGTATVPPGNEVEVRVNAVAIVIVMD